MAAEICTDSFLINMLGNLICTFELEDKSAVLAIYGTVPFSKKFLYTPGTGTDTEHANYGFKVFYDPSPGTPNPNPPPDFLNPDADFPPGVTITGSFDRAPDLSGNLTEPREAIFNGIVTIDEDTYPGSNDRRYANRVIVTLGFNPGV